MTGFLRWSLALSIASVLLVFPVVYYRATFERSKRLREVTPGILYRSGQLNAEGLADAVKRLGIRTVINLRDEAPDPEVQNSFFDWRTTSESELCKRLGVRYVFILPDLVQRRQIATKHPVAIDRFVKILDDPTSYPILVHCRAGLNRTGVMVAVYRMEHDGWTVRQAWDELRRNGFGEFTSTDDNDYITQYVLTYKPLPRGHPAMKASAGR